MRTITHRPKAAAILGSLRSIGYSFNTALADIVDNSISARARFVDIALERVADSTMISIYDDGRGMDRPELIEAMRHGGVGAERARSTEDLGRYGLGLKTASLSQCRRLTVASIGAQGRLSIARWDVNEVERRNEWTLLLPPALAIATIPSVAKLRDSGKGTVVMWEDFDLALAGAADPYLALETLLDDARSHLSLIFQRFLKGGDAKTIITLSINGRQLTGFDPFLSSNPKTQSLPTEDVKLRGSRVSITAFILPQLKNIAPMELEQLGGSTGLRQGQGFYVYRNKRLIIAGTWFRMLRLDELTKLARVRIDIPNTMDDLWNLDVKKSTANPPEPVRRVLKRIIDRIANRSLAAFKDSTIRGKPHSIVPVWLRKSNANSTTYVVNREHPMIADILDDGSRAKDRTTDRVLRLIEMSVPYISISADVTGSTSLEASHSQIAQTMRELIVDWISKCGDDVAMKEAVINALPSLEPFANHPEITRALVEEYHLGN